MPAVSGGAAALRRRSGGRSIQKLGVAVFDVL
jgi:hypothetical protein